MIGGPDRIRTDDPYNANVMRSQLRYRPVPTDEIIIPEVSFVKQEELIKGIVRMGFSMRTMFIQ